MTIVIVVVFVVICITLLRRPRRFSAGVCTAQHMEEYYTASYSIKQPPPNHPYLDKEPLVSAFSHYYFVLTILERFYASLKRMFIRCSYFPFPNIDT